MAKKFSQFPSASSISPGDSVVGLKDGENTRFSFATFLSAIQSLFVPTSRKVNNKALSSDISLNASDVGAVGTADVGVADGVASLDSNGKVPGTQLDLSGKQDTITASGIIKGDGQGGVSAATPGTDYQAPLTAGTDYATPAMIPSVPSAYTSNPAMDGTASPGSSGAWARGNHVHPSDTSRVPVYGMGKNLLRNWYFVGGGTGRGVFPVNQRGQSSYSNATYTVDGWKIRQTGNSLQVNSSGVTFFKGSTYAQCDFHQYIDNATLAQLLGKRVTATILWDSTHLDTVAFTWVSSNLSVMSGTGWQLLCGGTASVYINFCIRCSTTSLSVQAVKLELGTEQTLAHQENGIWVLNEIPDYEEELIKCQTSTADSSDTYANKTLATAQEIASVEDGATASQGYAVGKYFCRHGLTYRAKTAISAGDSFTVGTNCEVTNGGGLNDIGNTMGTISAVSGNSTMQNGGYYKVGHFVIFAVAVRASKNLVSGDLVCQGLPPSGVNNVGIRFYNNNSSTFVDAILMNTGEIMLKSSVSNSQSIRATGAYTV